MMNHLEGARGSDVKSKEPTGAQNYAEGPKRQPTNENNQIPAGDSRGIQYTQKQAEDYLAKHKIYELFNFLIGHLLVDEPDDPIDYLGDLLSKCMLFKSGLAEPPLLFTSRHIEGMFQSLDPSGLGNISLEQYRTGMKTLGISEYNQEPVECAAGRVDRQTFQAEAEKCLVESLANIVGKSQ